MDIETGCVDELFEKPRVDVHKGNGKTVRGGNNGYKCFTPGFNPLIGKSIHGTAISKNQKKSMANSVLEEFSPEVLYSLKKKKRWENFSTVDSVLTTAMEDSPSFTVSAVEKNPTGYIPFNVIRQQRIQTYGRTKPDSEEVERISTKSKTGGPFLSLEDTLEYKDGEKIKKKKFKKQDIRPRNPEVTFIIEKQADAQKLPAMSFAPYEIPYKGVMKTHRSNRFFYDLFDKGEEIFDESDEEILDEIEDDGTLHDFDGEIIEDFDMEMLDDIDDEMIEKSKAFQLSDFVKSPSPKKKRVHQKKIKDVEFIDEIPSELLESNDRQKPLNERVILKNSSFFSNEVEISSFFLKPEDFVPKLEEWVEENKNLIKIIWLDEDKTRCLLDFSKILGSSHLVAVVGFTLMGKKKRFLRITFNTSFPFEYPERHFTKLCKTKKMTISFFGLILNCLKESYSPVLSRGKNIKSLEEAYQCKSNVAMESFNEYDLLEKFSKPMEASVFESPSQSSLESLHFDSCEFCDHKNPVNLINLSCIHSLCLSCATFAFKSQIVNHSKEIVCPICDSAQDLMKLTFVVPIPLIKTFLKEKFRKISKNRTQECPKCLEYFERVPETSSVDCKKCCISFCQDCLLPPHFPISCDQMRTWFPKFEAQYKVHCLNEIPKYGQCCCGSFTELSTPSGEKHSCVTCNECKKHYRVDQCDNWMNYGYGSATQLRVLKASEIPTYIKNPFGELAVEARSEMRNESKTIEIRKLGREFLGEDELGDFIDLRFKILRLIEYGTAWLYFERKNQGSDKNKEISKSLRKLKTLLDVVVYQIINKSGSKIQENLTSLQDSYSKALTMF